MRYQTEENTKESAERYPPAGAGWGEDGYDVDYIDEEQDCKH